MRDNPPQLLQPWFDRIKAALAAVKDVEIDFATPYRNTEELTARDGQKAIVLEALVDPETGPQFDEEALPYYNARFPDGEVVVIGEEEIFSHDPRVAELVKAVAAGFSLSRELDYVGPFHLAEEGSDAHKAHFASQVATWVGDGSFMSDDDWVPPAYRKAKTRRKAKTGGKSA